MKTQSFTLRCPSCNHSFSPTEAIWTELKGSIQSELKSEIIAKEAELQSAKAEFLEQRLQLSKDKEELELLVLSKVKTRESDLRRQIEIQIAAEKEEELQLMQTELANKSKQLSELNKTKRELLVLQQDMKDKESEIEFQYQRKLRDQLEMVRDAARAKAIEESSMALAQKEKLISDLKAQIQTAKYTADSYSGQLVGETQELFLEREIRESFPSDRILPVPKGVNGADTIIEIMVSGVCAGRLLLESKAVKTFSKNWLKKLHDDNLAVGAQGIILCVRQMPRGFEEDNFTIMDNVFITTPSSLKSLIVILRHSVLRIAEVTKAYRGKETKEELIFQFLTSVDFQNIAQNALKQLDALKLNFDQEKKKVTKLWAERETMLERAITSNVELYGRLRALSDEIPEIDDLEVTLKKAA